MSTLPDALGGACRDGEPLPRAAAAPPALPSLALSMRRAVKRALLLLGIPTAMLRRSNLALVLFYHGISDAGIPAREFEAQLRYLSAHFEPIFASEIGAPPASGRMPVAITFDDGLKNNRDVVLPLLQRYGIKATFFVLPGDVAWLWTSEMRERLRGEAGTGLEVEGRRLQDRASIDRFVEDLKTRPFDDFARTVERVRAQTSFAPSSAWRADHELMTPDELRALPADLIELGAHTVHHHMLPQLDRARLRAEIVEGKRRLEVMLGRPVRTLSYPNGAFDRRSLELAARHYDFAFTTEDALAQDPRLAAFRGHPHAIDRLHGTDRFVDLPFAMYRFLKGGGGFRAPMPDGGGGEA